MPTKTPLKIWGIMEGPFHRDDFPEDELYDLGISEDVEWMIVAQELTGRETVHEVHREWS